MVQTETSRPRGRPREFDESQALDAAASVFWSRGYDGASLDDLTRAMGMTRSSLYNAFRDKKSLFFTAVEHYSNTRMKPLADRLNAGDSLFHDFEAFLDGAIDVATQDDNRRGCLIVCALADSAGADPQMREELASRFSMFEAMIVRRLQRGLREGELPAGTDCSAMAGVLCAAARGLLLGARAGTSAEDLRKTGRSLLGLLFGAAPRQSLI